MNPAVRPGIRVRSALLAAQSVRLTGEGELRATWAEA